MNREACQGIIWKHFFRGVTGQCDIELIAMDFHTYVRISKVSDC